VKNTLKSIYLNFRKYLFRVFAIFISQKRVFHDRSGPEVKKILFIRIDRLGDLVLSTPAIKAIKETYPRSKLVVLASRANCSLLENNPYVDHTVIYDPSKNLWTKIRNILQLRNYRFDLAIDPYADYELKTALIAFLSGAKKRIGYVSYGREIFFNLRAPEIEKEKHFVDLTIDVLKPIGVISKENNPEIFLVGDEKKWARNWLKERRLGTKPIVGIHPGAYYESQRWPSENFAEIVCQLKKDNSVDLILFGGPGDEMQIDRIASLSGEDIVTYITDDLRQFSVLVSCCRVFICNNSGPLHIAVAVNTPTISFMGPTHKNRWMPIGDIHKVLRIDDLSCIGCNLGYCKIKTHDCMELISPQMVMDAAEELLKTKSA